LGEVFVIVKSLLGASYVRCAELVGHKRILRLLLAQGKGGTVAPAVSEVRQKEALDSGLAACDWLG
ncbi:MAG: hypothetical protein WA603_14085, partial [Candidatus Acidiferrales bacterium]